MFRKACLVFAVALGLPLAAADFPLVAVGGGDLLLLLELVLVALVLRWRRGRLKPSCPASTRTGGHPGGPRGRIALGRGDPAVQ